MGRVKDLGVVQKQLLLPERIFPLQMKHTALYLNIELLLNYIRGYGQISSL